MAKCWDGEEVICTCGGETEYLSDEDYGYSDYEVFTCKECGKRIKIELPE
jgi:hypothetical protein